MAMNPQQRNTFLYIFCGIILVVGITLAIYFGVSSPPPPYSVQYPNCMQIQSPTYKKANLKLIGNGRCDRQVGGNMTYGLNTIECGYDDGDCDDFNEKYKKCDRNKHPSLLYDLGKGDCKVKYNIVECGYDDNLCADFNRNYPKCRTEKPGLVGDGKCNFDGDANTVQCRYDGGDCLNEDLPNCNGINIERLGDGRCHRELNTKDCDFDDGDCKLFNEEFPDCDVSKPYYLYDNVCDNGPPNRFGNKEYNNAECKYDGGACSRFNNQYGDDCYADDISLLGDGKCHNDVDYNSRACDIDGGDCVDFNNDPDYINCNVFNAWALNNGVCDHYVRSHDEDDKDAKNVRIEEFEHNTPECAYDGGDCIRFNRLYPNCLAKYPERVGDGVCDREYDHPDCKFDGGDCSIRFRG